MNPLDKISGLLPKIDEKNRYYILGGILVFIFLMDYFLVLQPQLSTLRSINPKITLLEGDLNNARDNVKKTNQYEADLVKLREQLKAIERQVISKEEVPMVLEKISRMANKFSVKIDQIMPLKGSEEIALKNKENRYLYLPILVQARSGYHNFGRFLNALETDAIFLNVTDFSFTADGNDPERHVAKLTIKIIIFEKTEEGNKES